MAFDPFALVKPEQPVEKIVYVTAKEPVSTILGIDEKYIIGVIIGVIIITFIMEIE